MSELCLVCGDIVGSDGRSTKDMTDYSKKTIIDTLGEIKKKITKIKFIN
jgi:hypothetical protein